MAISAVTGALVLAAFVSVSYGAVVHVDPGAKRLLEFGPNDKRWVSMEELESLIGQPGKRNGGFIDVTDIKLNRSATSSDLEALIPSEPKFQHLVESYLDQMDLTGIHDTLSHLTSYLNRYYTTANGREAVLYMEEQYKAAAGIRTDVRIELFEHSWEQPSLIVTIIGSGSNRDETVIIGGHIDSTAGGAEDKAPGADDDGSGSATVLEIFRTLCKNRFTPDRTVEFHVYAAEEVGLRGSAEIAETYKALGRKVVSMLNLDMVGYPSDLTTPMGLTSDYTSHVLNAFLDKVNAAYSVIPSETSECGYACSDHASFERNGFPSAFPFECKFGNHNPAIHSANDDLSHITIARCNEFAKMGLGYVVEVSLSA